MNQIFAIGKRAHKIQLMRVEMPFKNLLDELELAEAESRKPHMKTVSIGPLKPEEFVTFCSQNRLLEAGQWNGIGVYVLPDFIWPQPPNDAES